MFVLFATGWLGAAPGRGGTHVDSDFEDPHDSLAGNHAHYGRPRKFDGWVNTSAVFGNVTLSGIWIVNREPSNRNLILRIESKKGKLRRSNDTDLRHEEAERAQSLHLWSFRKSKTFFGNSKQLIEIGIWNGNSLICENAIKSRTFSGFERTLIQRIYSY